MKTIQSPDHLLSHLARKGDPSAFYTLVAPCAHTTYKALRNTGKNHKETMSQVIPFLKKLYRGFPEKPDDIDFTSWYMNKQRKYLDAIPEPSQDISEELFFGQISASDLTHLDSQMKLLFMRNYNKVREQGKRIFRKGWFHSLWSNFFMRWAFILVLFFAVCAGFQSYLTLAHIQLTLSVDSITMHRAITIPSAINKRLFPRPTAQSPSITTSIASRSDTMPFPSLKADSIYKASGVRRCVGSQTLMHSASFSTGQQKPAAVSMRQKPALDSIPPPHKRPALLSDSSTVVQ